MRHAEHGTDQTALLKRLSRIEGQVRGVSGMVEQHRYCIDIIHQISSIRKALDSVAMMMMENHINHCVRNALEHHDGEAKVKELIQAINRFVK